MAAEVCVSSRARPDACCELSAWRRRYQCNTGLNPPTSGDSWNPVSRRGCVALHRIVSPVDGAAPDDADRYTQCRYILCTMPRPWMHAAASEDQTCPSVERPCLCRLKERPRVERNVSRSLEVLMKEQGRQCYPDELLWVVSGHMPTRSLRSPAVRCHPAMVSCDGMAA